MGAEVDQRLQNIQLQVQQESTNMRAKIQGNMRQMMKQLFNQLSSAGMMKPPPHSLLILLAPPETRPM